MKFQTQSGSVYEVNTDSKKVRRLQGMNDPTPRMGKEGEWRPYFSLLPDPPEVGSQVVIVWGDDTKPLPETDCSCGIIIPTTMTSNVVSIEQ